MRGWNRLILINGLVAALTACGKAPVLQFGPATGADAAVAAEAPPIAYPSAPVQAGDSPIRWQKRVDARMPGAQAWEPSMVVHSAGSTADADQLTLIWMDGRPGTITDTRIAYARSVDGGTTFVQGDLPKPAQISANAPAFDPMTAVNTETGAVLVGAMTRSFSNGADNVLWLSRHAGGNAPLTTAETLLGQTNIDKGWMVAGPLPGNLTQTVTYLAFNATNRRLMRSLDGGRTFSQPLTLPGIIGFQPRINANGRLSISYFDNGPVALVTSDDGGLSLNPPVTVARPAVTALTINTYIPGDFRVPPFLMHAVDPASGRLYGVYSDLTRTVAGQGDLNIILTTSDDGGQTWSPGRVINGDDSVPGDQFMPWIEVDRRGGVHVIWFDTRRNPGQDTDAHALVDVWYASSRDRGQTWTETRLTDQPLDSDRTRWSPFGTGTPFLGDYLAMAVSDHAVYAAYPGIDGNDVAMWLTRIDLPTAEINANFTGTWINNAQPGHGMLIEILPGNRLLAWWFTFTPDGQQAWFGGIGTYAGNVATIEVIKAEGGRFLPNFNPADIRNPVLGTMSIRFDSCTQGQVDYALGQGFGSGSWSIDRLTVAAGLACID